MGNGTYDIKKNAQKYLEILVDSNLWSGISPIMITSTKDDNPVHRALIMTDFTEANNINTMTWPAQSSEINIIENVWLIFF